MLMTEAEKDYAVGTSVSDLNRKYHLSENSIRRILQNPYTKSQDQFRLCCMIDRKRFCATILLDNLRLGDV